MYVRETQGMQEFSSCDTIRLIYDHEDLAKGQWVSNPSEELIAAEDWVEYVPPITPPEPQTEPSEWEKVEAINRMLSANVVALDDEAALQVIALFPAWVNTIGKEVHVGERYYYDEALWKVLQDHTAQAEWHPDVAHSLFVKVSIEEWPEWVQPTGATEAYAQGAKVTHNSQHWISLVDGNVWEPSESVPALWQLV